jgi:hypothetical protein
MFVGSVSVLYRERVSDSSIHQKRVNAHASFDTAAVMKNLLDFLITTKTAIVHVAGTLGVPTYSGSGSNGSQTRKKGTGSRPCLNLSHRRFGLRAACLPPFSVRYSSVIRCRWCFPQPPEPGKGAGTVGPNPCLLKLPEFTIFAKRFLTPLIFPGS